MQSDPLNEQFRRRLLDAQVEPPDDMWARVADRLQQERKAIPLRWSSWGIRAAAGLALILGFSWCIRLALQPQPSAPFAGHHPAIKVPVVTSGASPYSKPGLNAAADGFAAVEKSAVKKAAVTRGVSKGGNGLQQQPVASRDYTVALTCTGPPDIPPANEYRQQYQLPHISQLTHIGPVLELVSEENAIPRHLNLIDTRPVWVTPPLSSSGDVVPSKWAFGLTSTAGATHTSNLSAAFQQQVLVWDTLGISSNGGQPASRDVVATLSYPTAKISTGLQFEYLLGAGWGIQSGIGITRNTLTTATALQGAEALGLSNRNNNLSQDDYSVIAQNSTRAVSTQLAVPVLLNKYFKKGRSSLLLSGGIQVQRLMSRQPKVNYILVDASNNPATVFEANNLPQNTPEVLPEMALGALMRIQYQYQLNERWALHGGPSLLANATPAFNIDGINGRAPFAAGLEIGLKYYPSADSR